MCKLRLCWIQQMTLALLLIGTLLVLGCDNEKPATKTETAVKEKPLVGVLVFRVEDPYVGFVTKAIQKKLEGKADVVVHSADYDQVRQNAQLHELIKSKVDALAINLADAKAGAAVINAVAAANIPVVFFNVEPDTEVLKQYDKARYVGTTAAESGRIQGEIIAELWKGNNAFDKNGDGICQYVMIQGRLDSPEPLARSEYSVKQARDRGVLMQQFGDSLVCDWDETLTYNAIKPVLADSVDAIELIISNNDSMALGAIKALQEQGFNLEGSPDKAIPVVGVDAIPAAVDAITKGIMHGTVIQDSEAMGRTVAVMLQNAVEGKPWLEGIAYPWDESGVAVRIPYKAYGKKE